ncbi:Hypothetical Protein RSKD131_3081 [Cereibacter sphaeroides KD131]|nr:Hypothetical Protein RSKD131_3081 [Cereibacter sphaeroides KD131]
MHLAKSSDALCVQRLRWVHASEIHTASSPMPRERLFPVLQRHPGPIGCRSAPEMGADRERV